MSDQEDNVFGDYEKPSDQKWTIPDDPEQGVYRFVIAAARRARHLQSGALPLVSTTSRKSTTVAMEEVRQGKVKVDILAEGESWPADDQDPDLPSEEAGGNDSPDQSTPHRQ